MNFIKKHQHYLEVILLILVFGVLPTMTYAAALSSLESERSQLVSQVASLHKELAAGQQVAFAGGQ